MEALQIAMMVLFLHATTWDGHIFKGIKKIIKPEGKFYKAIYGCPICMTPWWGSLIYWLFYAEGFEHWVITIGSAAGINVLSVIGITVRDYFVKLKKEKDAKG